MSDLELSRAQKQAKVDEVVPYSDIQLQAKKQGVERPGVADVTACFLKRKKVREITVPYNFNLGLADALRQRGIRVFSKEEPFFEERVTKSTEEIRKITQSLRHTEAAIHKVENLLRASKVVGKKIAYRGQWVTSELLKKVLNVSMMENNCIGSHTIVASGDQGCDPHQEGSGFIWANQSLVVDVFPKVGRYILLRRYHPYLREGKTKSGLEGPVRGGQNRPREGDRYGRPRGEWQRCA